MPGTIALFWKLCLLRVGPEQVPYSPRLTVLVLALWLAVALPLANSVPGLGEKRALLFLVATLAIEFTFVALLLSWRRFSARLLQTVTALLGADCLLNLLSLPMVLPFAGETSPAAVYAALAQLLLFGWGVVVKGHVLRSALEVPRAAAMLLAVALVLLNMALVGALFPDLVAAAGATD